MSFVGVDLTFYLHNLLNVKNEIKKLVEQFLIAIIIIIIKENKIDLIYAEYNKTLFNGTLINNITKRNVTL